jgi:hypothetical protein
MFECKRMCLMKGSWAAVAYMEVTTFIGVL